jgi:hypothetical protein
VGDRGGIPASPDPVGTAVRSSLALLKARRGTITLRVALY